MVHTDSAPGKAGGTHTSPTDREGRLSAFTDLLDAVDRGDFRAGLLATRRLRKLGLSVVLTKPQGPAVPR